MDILAALENLEESEREKKHKQRGGKPLSVAERNALKNAKAGQSSKASPRSKSQVSTRSTGPASHAKLSIEDVNVPSRAGAQSPAPSTGGESRRISFSEPTRPDGTKVWIPTKSDYLGSGFEYDARLIKYNVGEEEWAHFNQEFLEAAHVPKPAWLWPFRKDKVTKRIKRDLQYDGDISKAFKKWNRVFKLQRFQAWLEIPGQRSSMMSGNDANEKIDVGKFRVVITPNNERPPSVYSRSNSLTRSVTGEGMQAVKGRKSAEAAKAEAEAEVDNETAE